MASLDFDPDQISGDLIEITGDLGEADCAAEPSCAEGGSAAATTAAALAPVAQSGRARATATRAFTLGAFFCTNAESW